MTRPRTSLAAALLLLLASCGPQAAPVSTATSTPRAAAVETPVSHAPEIRFALVGEVTDANVWALFDAKGYSYNNYAVRSEYWPRLYRLSIPDRQFQPMAASGMPSTVRRDGDFYAAAVPLRSDLNWTDGSPFTAEDVAFTVNAALSFQLGFDWHDYYNPDWLDHVEAVDAHAVKFYFKKAPNVGAWQYGALQGPIVQKAYWLPKIAASQALLPSSELASQIEAFKVRVADLQQQVDALNAAAATAPANGEEARQNQMTLNRQQRDLNAATSDLAKAQSDFAAAMNAARQSLYALEDKDEPTLGDWMPAGEENGAWINKVNPAHPFNTPKFDRATYQTFEDEDSALNALKNNEVDEILSSSGFSKNIRQQFMQDLTIKTAENFTSQIRFLAFNQSKPILTDPIFRKAMSCLAINAFFSGVDVKNLNTFEPRGSTFEGPAGYSENQKPCADFSAETSFAQVIEILKTGGYFWDQEPVTDVPEPGATIFRGTDLKKKDGSVLAPIALLVKSNDILQVNVAKRIVEHAHLFGIPLVLQVESPENVNYEVFSSHQFDMAILGWQVSEYPGYLCDWFGDGNPFGYRSDRLRSACEALNSTSNLDQARQQVYEIQSVLAQDLPFIPLYSGVAYDAYRNITYPFDSVPGGLSGVYGAPSLAIPASH